ncbi:MAG: hypothetical protein AYK18_01525 [Theionarchaea archaeon DG-70]|nr:MAG: hypothetical protein AYK18_01525 [Theionarchaea archaeon DG-70]
MPNAQEKIYIELPIPLTSDITKKKIIVLFEVIMLLVSAVSGSNVSFSENSYHTDFSVIDEKIHCYRVTSEN